MCAAPMASGAQPQQPAALQQQQEEEAQAQKPTRVSLSYEEISKLFSLPIAEAASILGVCTSVLKRICRSHGIVRWPYRKLVSGKSGDDTKSAEREKAKELLEISRLAKQKALSASGLSTVSPGTFQGVAKSQQGSSKAGQVSPPGKQNALSGSGILAHGTQTKAIPTYMDDFKHGFPSCGLSWETMKWWGTDSHTETTPAKDENGEAPESANEASKGMTDDDELDWGADEAEAEAITTEPSAQLCTLRRKAVDDGRKLLTGKTCGSLELCRLNKRQKMALAQVFGASLPEQSSRLG
ncbi:protein NLP2-like [Oryza brachyantha]|uniref:RWP-RK domain-containing protein n=1 Tax=Oryza brachyantha TaxID=4533 RepID=J3KY80_ORYBR|nr:protein NLP2-like [Oryza brachyantha]